MDDTIMALMNLTITICEFTTQSVFMEANADNSADLYMRPAIRSGLLDSYRSPSNITGYCPSSQCTWDPYTTLALCLLWKILLQL